jgi:hypothetical protein
VSNLDTVQLMDFGNGETVYVTGGHIDLKTFIERAGGVGSTWSYVPGQVLHCWLKPNSEDFIFCGEDNPGEDGVAITVVLEPDNLAPEHRRPKPC